MPFTPFHLGPVLMLGQLLFSHLDSPTLAVSSIALDIEPAVASVFGLSYPGYGWFHTLEGSMVAVAIVAAVMYGLRSRTGRLLSSLKLKQESSPRKVVLAPFLGVYLHLLLDAPLHAMYDLRVPRVEQTPMGLTIYGFCVLSFSVGLMLYWRRLK